MGGRKLQARVFVTDCLSAAKAGAVRSRPTLYSLALARIGNRRAFAIPSAPRGANIEDFQRRQFRVLLMIRWRIKLGHQNSPKRNGTYGMADSSGKSKHG